MEIKMKMPDLATTDSAIKVIRWLVTPGQSIKRGQALLEVETDKATMEVECIATGVFKEPRAQPGDTLLAGQILAVIEVEGGAPARPAPPTPAPAAAPPMPAPPAPAAAPTPAPAAGLAPAPKPAGGMFAKNRDAANRRAP